MILRYAARSASAGATILIAAAGLLGCGPDLTSPGDTNVSGTWFATGPAAGMTNITMVLTQTPDGEVAGTYTATGTPGRQVCPITEPCALSSTISGANTVLQINLELKNAGTFTGQLIGPTTLRGTMTRSGDTLVEFARTAGS